MTVHIRAQSALRAPAARICIAHEALEESVVLRLSDEMPDECDEVVSSAQATLWAAEPCAWCACSCSWAAAGGTDGCAGSSAAAGTVGGRAAGTAGTAVACRRLAASACWLSSARCRRAWGRRAAWAPSGCAAPSRRAR
eukprot:6190978-Pleurochrysis_carterae.AAC.2